MTTLILDVARDAVHLEADLVLQQRPRRTGNSWDIPAYNLKRGLRSFVLGVSYSYGII
jgi:hypothetical protein